MDIITCAAPDQRRNCDDLQLSLSDDAIIDIFEKRFRRIFELAYHNKVQVLILGAFGCGVFGNPPELVAKAADKICREFSGKYDSLEFAIFEPVIKGKNYQGFLDNIYGIQEV